MAIVVLLIVGFIRKDVREIAADTRRSVASAEEDGAARGKTAPAARSVSSAAPEMLTQPPILVPVSASTGKSKRLRNSRSTAHTFEEVLRSIVKFEMPMPDGSMVTGTGFLIDRRGWVATNYHVAVRASTAARVKLESGQKVGIEGIVAVSPERDLAIVKLPDLPDDLLPLDISTRMVPKIGSRVYAYGNPLYNEFSLVEGIVSRVLTTTEFAAQQPNSANVLTKLNAPPDQLWIQTDARVSQGNSGGPLFDERCRVIGINTFANLDAQFGFASHIRYLKELADGASGEVTPLDDQPGRSKQGDTRKAMRYSKTIVISRERLQEAFDAVAAFGWKPTSQDEYQIMKNLALMATVCTKPGENKIPFEIVDLVDTQFSRLNRNSWTDAQVKAINAQAEEQCNVGEGIVFVAKVLFVLNDKNASGRSALLMFAPGISKMFLVPLDSDMLAPSQGARVLVIGIVEPQTFRAKLSHEPDAKEWPVFLTRSHNLLSI